MLIVMSPEPPIDGHGASRPTRDPKTIVTHHAFRVDPDLLGRPLAGPGRRLLGIFVDLCVLGLLFPLRAAASVLLGGIMDLLVALAVAWLLFHLSSQRSRGEVPARGVRWLLRGTAVIIALAGLAGFIGGDGPDTGDSGPPAVVAGADSTPQQPGISALQAIPGVSGTTIEVDGRSIPFGEVAGGLNDVLTLARAGSPEEATPVAERTAMSLYRMGADPPDVRQALIEIMSSRVDSTSAWMREVAEDATAGIDSLAREARRDADSILVRYAGALTADDTAAADSLRPLLRTAVAGEELSELQEENEELEEELEEARSSSGLVDRLVSLLTEDLGIGLGWLGIYFTAFLALWGGRTPGKRLLGMRVVKLSGEPLGWWASFERFGGYAAGVATGLMGFAEIFWDPNRQAIHDKVAATVVVRTRGKAYEAWRARLEKRRGGRGPGAGGSGNHDAGSGIYRGTRGPHPHLDADR
jgi:uncharacterized RDD family membrane protein YckC